MRKPPWSATGTLLPATLSLLLAAGCDWPGKPDPAQRPVPADQVLDFATLFEQNCSGCHGDKGKGGPAPPLNDPLFLSIIPEAELLRVVREGRRGTPMPAFVQEHGGPLTADQVKALAAGVKTEWGTPPGARKGQVPPYLLGSPGAAGLGRDMVERGKKVFRRACAVCHGNDGEGMENKGRLRHRIHDPAFLALISDQALRRIVITGRADLGMPGYDEPRPDASDFEPLTAAEVDDVVALLSSWAPERPGRGKGVESRGGK